MNLSAAQTLLLIIDVQNDFCPGGALAVQDGGGVIPLLNALSRALAARGGKTAATQDWHPASHVSFASSHNKAPGETIDTALVKGQALWPDHCVQGTRGAAFHDELDLKPVSLIIRKGFRAELDSYSAFFENDHKTPTGLEGWIQCLKPRVKTVVLGGLAVDYCVLFSAMDCKRLGFDTVIASDAVRGVGIPKGSVERAITAMKDAGIGFAASAQLLEELR